MRYHTYHMQCIHIHIHIRYYYLSPIFHYTNTDEAQRIYSSEQSNGFLSRMDIRGEKYGNVTSLPNHFVANVPNYDNGNLMYLLLELIHPSLYFSCISAVYQMTSADLSSLSNVYHQTIVECFKLLLPSIQTRVSTIAPYIHIFLPHQGFWSTHARQDRFGK